MKTPLESREKRHSDLEKQYLSNPGIKELLSIYNSFWKKDQVIHQEVYQNIQDTSGYAITDSISSNPKSAVY